MRTLKQIALTSIILIAIFAIGLSLRSYRSMTAKYSGRPGAITVGMEATPVNSLIYIAEECGYFTDNGLKVTIKDDYPSGSAAAYKMLEGEVDVATSAESLVVRQAFESHEVKTLAGIDKFLHQYLIARKDRGVKSISDLKGKTLGVPLKTAGEFNFGRFLDLQGIPRDQLNVVDIQAPEAVDALTQGDVDGLVAWQPNALTLEERLGGNAKTWSIQNGQPTYCLLTTTDSWANEHPELVGRLLRSLAEAESYLINNPKRSKDLIQKRLGYDDAYIRRIWPEHQPSLSLDQSLILAMEDQARWMINNGLTDKQTIPDFEKYVYDKALAAVKPESVHIIHGGAKH